MSTVLRNVVRGRWRKQARGRSAVNQLPPTERTGDPLIRLEKQERARVLLLALEHLTPVQREVIELRFFDGLPPRKIARRLDVPVETVKTRQKRALGALRSRLDTQQGPGWSVSFLTCGDLGLRTASLAGSAAPAAAVGATAAASWIAAGGLALVVAALATANTAPSTPAQVEQPSIEVTGTTRGPDQAPGDRGHTAAPGLLGRGQPAEPKQGVQISEGPTTPPVADAEGDTVLLEGKLTVVTAEGKAVPPITGALGLVVFGERSGEGESIKVTEGVFRKHLPRGAKVEFRTVTFPGETALIEAPLETHRVLTGRLFDLRAKQLPRRNIRVIDAATGARIEKVWFQRMGGRNNRLPHPGRYAPGDDALIDAPIRTATPASVAGDYLTEYRVGAPGYSWARVILKPWEEIPRFVELHRAGSLQLHIPGSRRMREAALYIEPQPDSAREGWTARYELDYGTGLTIPNLAPGTYRVWGAAGPRHHLETVLGEATVEIKAGQVSKVKIPLVFPAPAKKVSWRARIHVPEPWNLENFRADLECMESFAPGGGSGHTALVLGVNLHPSASDPRVLECAVDAIRPGKHLAYFPTTGAFADVRVPATPGSPTRVVHPAQVEVVLAVEEPPRVGAGFLSQIHWYVDPRGRYLSFRSLRVERDRPDEPFRFVAPDQPLVIDTQDATRRVYRRLANPGASGGRHPLIVDHASRLEVVLQSGREIIPWVHTWPLALTRPDGSQGLLRHHGHDGRCLATAREPGPHTLRVGPLPGYEPIAPLQVELEAGVLRRVVVHLAERR